MKFPQNFNETLFGVVVYHTRFAALIKFCIISLQLDLHRIVQYYQLFMLLGYNWLEMRKVKMSLFARLLVRKATISTWHWCITSWQGLSNLKIESLSHLHTFRTIIIFVLKWNGWHFGSDSTALLSLVAEKLAISPCLCFCASERKGPNA